MSSSSSSGFYKELPLLAQAHDMVDAAHHHAVPQDWLVVVADIKGSTRAIAAGRYKEVNMISASAITAVLNAVRAATGAQKNDTIAYVFGGDGATFLVPPDLLLPVAQALYGTQQMAQQDYGLDLRAGRCRCRSLWRRARRFLWQNLAFPKGCRRLRYRGQASALPKSG